MTRMMGKDPVTKYALQIGRKTMKFEKIPGEKLIGYFCVRSISVITFQKIAAAPAAVLISPAQEFPVNPTRIAVLRLRICFLINAPLLISTASEKSVQKVELSIRTHPAAVQLAAADWQATLG